jgi:catechol 2,3-dioxygenase-like lactoylglutathione lyase family enzyme
MRPKVIDHINVHVPEDEVDRAVEFYRDWLGFETANLEAYRAGDRSLFTFRPSEGCVIHVMPVEEFEPPGRNLNHVAVLLDDTLEEVEETIADAGVEVVRRRDRSDRPGADVAIYVRDPFGYTIELRPEPEPDA